MSPTGSCDWKVGQKGRRKVNRGEGGCRKKGEHRFGLGDPWPGGLRGTRAKASEKTYQPWISKSERFDLEHNIARGVID